MAVHRLEQGSRILVAFFHDLAYDFGVSQRSAPAPGPIDSDERLHSLDVLRGLALFGIVLVHFHQRARIETSGFEDLIAWGVWVLVEQKVWGTLALLSGAYSSAWLRHFRFGPLEWLWRTVTYARIQPLRKPRSSLVEVAA